MELNYLVPTGRLCNKFAFDDCILICSVSGEFYFVALDEYLHPRLYQYMLKVNTCENSKSVASTVNVINNTDKPVFLQRAFVKFYRLGQTATS